MGFVFLLLFIGFIISAILIMFLYPKYINEKQTEIIYKGLLVQSAIAGIFMVVTGAGSST